MDELDHSDLITPGAARTCTAPAGYWSWRDKPSSSHGRQSSSRTPLTTVRAGRRTGAVALGPEARLRRVDRHLEALADERVARHVADVVPDAVGVGRIPRKFELCDLDAARGWGHVAGALDG